MDGAAHPVDPLVQPFVGMDVYLFDQLQRGRVRPGARVLDVGAGSGRNLAWFVERGHPCVAVEPDPERAASLGERLAARGLDLPGRALLGAPIERAPLEEGSFDLVLSVAVLHFARDHGHFDAMLEASWRALAPGGVFFARLASSVGLERRVRPLGGGRHLLPDGTERYLVDDGRLQEAAARLGALQLDPIKSTVVQGLRTMTTWVLGRPAG